MADRTVSMCRLYAATAEASSYQSLPISRSSSRTAITCQEPLSGAGCCLTIGKMFSSKLRHHVDASLLTDSNTSASGKAAAISRQKLAAGQSMAAMQS